MLVDPGRARLIETLAREGALTRYQRRLIAFAVEPAGYPSFEDKAALVEQIYAQGIGVTPSPDAARLWHGLATAKGGGQKSTISTSLP